MPIYQGRRASTWRVTIYHRGKQHEWIVQGTRRDARRWEQDKRAELRARPVVAGRAEPTFSDYCVSHYRPHAEAHLGAETWGERTYIVARLGEVFGAMRLSEITAAEIDRYQQAEMARGLKPRSINHMVTCLKVILRFAHKRGALDAVPEIKMLKVGVRQARAWTMAEVRALYAALSQVAPRMVAMAHFLLETGVRKGEAIRAEWTWVDWDAGVLRVPVTEAWKPKNGRGRDVPLSTALLATLRRMPRDAATLFVADAPNCRGERYREFPYHLWHKAIDAAQITGPRGAHQTRHTYASHFLTRVPDLGLLAQILGHSELRVTQLYAHMLPDRWARARGAVDLPPPGSGPMRTNKPPESRQSTSRPKRISGA